MDGDLIATLPTLVDDKNRETASLTRCFRCAKRTWPGISSHLWRRVRTRRTPDLQILFEPLEKHTCLNIGGDDETLPRPAWKGEAWIDAAELEPVESSLTRPFEVPWGVKVFLGTNLQQTGFSITYKRLAENAWFPVSYGTEFRFNVLWGYKRTVTLSLQSDGFQKTDADSKIEYQVASEPPF